MHKKIESRTLVEKGSRKKNPAEILGNLVGCPICGLIVPEEKTWGGQCKSCNPVDKDKLLEK